MPLSCRYYEHRFPEIEDVVMVTVRSIADMGAYVELLEYNNIEGMILLSELSRRRIRSINKLIRVGKSECVVVIRVDKDKGYIDLSKRRVSQEEIAKCEEKFAKAKCVNSILRHVGELLNYESDDQLETLYKKTAWHFDKIYGKPGAAYEAFKRAVTNPEIFEECDLDPKTKSVLVDNIKQRLAPQAVKIRSDIQVSCYAYEGVDAVKNALRAGLNLSTEEMPIKINLIAPPSYVVITHTLDRAEGVERLKSALEAIKKSIEASEGNFVITMQPVVVSATDDAELSKQLEKLEEANKERSGDDDDSDLGFDGSEAEDTDKDANEQAVE